MFKFKQKIKGPTRNDDWKDVEIMAPFKYLSNILRILEVPLMNCEINLQLKSFEKRFLVAGTVANQIYND